MHIKFPEIQQAWVAKDIQLKSAILAVFNTFKYYTLKIGLLARLS